MSQQNDLLQDSLSRITPRLIEEAAFLAFYGGIEHRAPLGHSGPTIFLYGASRVSQVSLRNHSGNIEMLITDTKGNFLFYGKLHAGLPLETIGAHFHNTFLLVLPYIEAVAPEPSILTER